MACPLCHELCGTREIRSPDNLRDAIVLAKSAIQRGIIAEQASESGMLWTEPFDQVSSDGPWDDILSYEFRCKACGERFSLSAETYHGSGGKWQRHGR